MKHGFILFILFIPFITSCRYQKPLTSEEVFFTPQNETIFYLINTIPLQTGGPQKSVRSLLVSEKNNTDKHSLSIFTSIVDGTSVVSSIGIIDSLFVFSKNRFPILLEGGRTDSLMPYVYWKMSRSTISASSIPAGISKEQTSYRINFRKQFPYKVHSVSKSPEIYSCTVLTSSFQPLHNNKNEEFLSSTYIHIFKNAGTILTHPHFEPLVWMDLKINQQTFSYFFTLKGKETPQLFFAKKDSVDLAVKNVEIVIENQGNWKSAASGKDYPLVFSIKNSGDASIIKTRPLLENQEIFMKQNSFWMGALEIQDSHTGSIIGTGNMYIFK